MQRGFVPQVTQGGNYPNIPPRGPGHLQQNPNPHPQFQNPNPQNRNPNHPTQNRPLQNQNPNRVQQLQSENARLQEELRELRAAKHERMQSLESELAGEKKRARNMVEQVQKKDEYITELGSLIKRKDAEARKKDDKYTTKVDENLALAAKIGERNKQIAELKTMVTDMDDCSKMYGSCCGCEFLEEELNHAGEKLKAARSLIAKYVADRERQIEYQILLQKELNSANSTIGSYTEQHQKQVEGMDKKIAALQAQLQKAAAIQAALTTAQNNIASNVQKYELEVEEARKEHQNHVERFSSLEKKCNDVEIEHAKAVAETTETNEKLSFLEKKHEDIITELTTCHKNILVNDARHKLEMEKVEKEAGDKIACLEKQYKKATTDLATANSTITAKNEEYKLKMAEVTKKAEEKFSGLETKNKDLETRYEQELADYKVKFEYAIGVAESWDQRRRTGASAPLLSKFWSRSYLFALLVVILAASVSFLDLTLPQAILSYLSPSPVASLPPVPSISALSRLQAVVYPLCHETMSIGPDLPSLTTEYFPPETCSLLCYLSKGWYWLGSQFW